MYVNEKVFAGVIYHTAFEKRIMRRRCSVGEIEVWEESCCGGTAVSEEDRGTTWTWRGISGDGETGQCDDLSLRFDHERI